MFQSHVILIIVTLFVLRGKGELLYYPGKCSTLVCGPEASCLQKGDFYTCLCPNGDKPSNDQRCPKLQVVPSSMYAVEPTAPRCSLHEYKCGDGKCIPEYELCDGHQDCSDGTDEDYTLCLNQKCPPEIGFKCAYGGCVATYLICDGRPDCIDGSDEDLDQCGYKWTECKPVKAITNGNYIETLCNPENLVEVCLQFSCNTGYILDEYRSKYISRCINNTWTPDIPRCIRCGLISNVRPLIFHAEKAANQPEPWFVGFWNNTEVGYKFYCGGSIVHSRAVITAAHCLKRFDEYTYEILDLFNSSNVRLAVGKKLSNFTKKETYQQVLEIESIKVQDTFNKNLDNDIAIVILKNKITITENILPVCLDGYFPDSSNEIPESMIRGKVVGFGESEKEKVSEKLLTAHFGISKLQICRDLVTEKDHVTKDKICVLAPEGVNASRPGPGDSGGGFIVEKNGTHFLFGIVQSSFRYTSVVLFTNISYHKKWLMNNLDPF